jgi:hypothetical protein
MSRLARAAVAQSKLRGEHSISPRATMSAKSSATAGWGTTRASSVELPGAPSLTVAFERQPSPPRARGVSARLVHGGGAADTPRARGYAARLANGVAPRRRGS